MDINVRVMNIIVMNMTKCTVHRRQIHHPQQGLPFQVFHRKSTQPGPLAAHRRLKLRACCTWHEPN